MTAVGKLGKHKALKDARSLKLVSYMPEVLPPNPLECRWDRVKDSSSWGMDGNDIYGLCVIATAAHILDSTNANESQNLTPVASQAVVELATQMNALDGYYILSRLRWWRKLGMFGTNITAFTEVEHGNHDLYKSAINIFGHLDIGLQLPKAWRGESFWSIQNPANLTTLDYEKGSWGGHSVPIIGYDATESPTLYYLVTWGEIVTITEDALDYYADEMYCSILPNWLAKDQLTPSGFKMADLLTDLNFLD